LKFFLDLKLEWNEDEHEIVTVPQELYDSACVFDGKEGEEVR
jgi:hypothetical protein